MVERTEGIITSWYAIIDGGAGEQSNINITGSDVSGKAGTGLIADNDITLQSAEQSSSERSNNKSSGWNAGAAVSFGQGGWSLGVTAGGNVGKGYGNGDSVTHRHNHIGEKGSQRHPGRSVCRTKDRGDVRP